MVNVIQEEIDLEFACSDERSERGVANQDFVLQQMHTALMALTNHEANGIVANLRKNPLEDLRRLQKHFYSNNMRSKAKLDAPAPPGRMLSCRTLYGGRTLGVVRVALREDAEGSTPRRDSAVFSRLRGS